MENLETRLNEVARIAVRIEQETGCPAQLLIAQWAIESKWGERPVGSHNYFGVKRAARHTQWCTVETREVVNGRSVIEDLEFADYDSLADSCRDYAWLITQGAPYCAAWARYLADRDLHALIEAVAGIYATDPNYARLCTIIAGQANVAQAIAEALQETPTNAAVISPPQTDPNQKGAEIVTSRP
jgi:flagellum-specific peptidoglycan hydrolase FlgJ